jgi:hypothetical protein
MGTGRQHGWLSLIRGSRGRVLALLLVGTLLLCHGVFGALHLCSDSSDPVHQDHKHLPLVDGAVGAHEHPSCHLMGTEYFAALLITFLGLILGLLLKGAWLWGRIIVSPGPSEHYFPLVVFHLPRGPTTLPALPVFRL